MGNLIEGLILMLFAFFLVWKLKPTKANKSTEVEKKGENINVPEKYYTPKNEINIQSALVERSAFMLLETIYIMETSKSADTIKGRNKSLRRCVNQLRSVCSNIRYKLEIQKAIDNYKTAYYDKIPSEIQIGALIIPNEFNVDAFYCLSIFNGFMRFYKYQMEQIEKLKQPDAIEKRKNKLFDVIEDVLNEITLNSELYPAWQELIIKLNNIYDDIYNYEKK